MSKFASLSSSSQPVRAKLQAALYYARERTKAARLQADAPLPFTGAVKGVLGSGGALPTGWMISAVTTSVMVVEVVSVEKRNGIDTIIIRISGTNNSGSARFPGIRVARVPAQPSQSYAFTCLAEILDLSIPFANTARNSLQTRLDTTLVGTTTFTNLSEAWQNRLVNRNTPAGINAIEAYIIDNTINNGASCDVTVQVGMMKLRRTT